MTRLIVGVTTILLTFLVFGIYDARAKANALERQTAAAAHTRDSLKARLAEAILAQAPARIDTVRQIVSSVKTLRDSVLVQKTDTLMVERFVYRVDSLRAECLKCAALLDTIQTRYADERRATETYISMLRVELQQAKRTRWTDRVGCGVGYGVQKVGSEVYAGPQVGCQVRAWPW